jgi:Uma2 family endonuclease
MVIKSPATIDDLLNTPEDGNKYELVDGEIVMTPAGMRHSEVAVNIAILLGNYVKKTRLGKIYSSDVGIRLPDKNVRSPDVTFVRTEKLPGGKSPESYGDLIPDLVVEVLSPHDNMRQVADKIGEYLQCGVPLVWLVDPAQGTVTVYQSLTDTQGFSSRDTITGQGVLPGFSCLVSEFFD